MEATADASPPRIPGIVMAVGDAGSAGPACPDASPAASVRNSAPPDVGAIPPYAQVSATGLGSCVIRAGASAVHPTADQTVAVQYVGWSTAGVSFDSSLGRAEVTFPLRALIQGWVEGVPLMVPGEIRRFWIPESLAYQGRPGRPAGMLVFDIELVRIVPDP